MNYSEYINSDEWKEKKENYLKEHPTCESILHKGLDVPSTEINHILYTNIGNEKDEDIEALCSECHKSIHTHFSFNKNDTLILSAADEMMNYYYDGRKNHNGNDILLLNSISDEFYDGKKLITYFERNTSNYFFQNIIQDLINRELFIKAYQMFIIKIAKVTDYYNKPKNDKKEVKKEEKKEIKLTFKQFLSLSSEERLEHEKVIGIDEEFEALENIVDIKDINLADLKSFINKSYMIPYYGCNVFFNKEGLSSRQNIEWFIKNKSSDYLQYIVDKNFNK